jgi:hypothetical protein
MSVQLEAGLASALSLDSRHLHMLRFYQYGKENLADSAQLCTSDIHT